MCFNLSPGLIVLHFPNACGVLNHSENSEKFKFTLFKLSIGDKFILIVIYCKLVSLLLYLFKK